MVYQRELPVVPVARVDGEIQYHIHSVVETCFPIQTPQSGRFPSLMHLNPSISSRQARVDAECLVLSSGVGSKMSNSSFEKDHMAMLRAFDGCVLDGKMPPPPHPGTTAAIDSILEPLLPSQQGPTCWRAPKTPVTKEEEEQARQEMVTLLAQRLIIKCQENGADDEQIHSTARALEQLLFKQAKDLRSYQDKTTLDDRLRGLLTILVRKKMMCKAKNAKKERARRLIQILGMDRYKHCIELVQKIKIAKANKVSRLRCNSQTCTRRLETNMPPVVRALYFETTMVHAFDKYPIDNLGNVDWCVLIEQAECNLHEFQMWEDGDEATIT